jgi:hypothetical protein
MRFFRELAETHVAKACFMDLIMSVRVPNVTLNNGVEMPILGFGVFQIPR